MMLAYPPSSTVPSRSRCRRSLRVAPSLIQSCSFLPQSCSFLDCGLQLCRLLGFTEEGGSSEQGPLSNTHSLTPREHQGLGDSRVAGAGRKNLRATIDPGHAQHPTQLAGWSEEKVVLATTLPSVQLQTVADVLVGCLSDLCACSLPSFLLSPTDPGTPVILHPHGLKSGVLHPSLVNPGSNHIFIPNRI